MISFCLALPTNSKPQRRRQKRYKGLAPPRRAPGRDRSEEAAGLSHRPLRPVNKCYALRADHPEVATHAQSQSVGMSRRMTQSPNGSRPSDRRIESWNVGKPMWFRPSPPVLDKCQIFDSINDLTVGIIDLQRDALCIRAEDGNVFLRGVEVIFPTGVLPFPVLVPWSGLF